LRLKAAVTPSASSIRGFKHRTRLDPVNANQNASTWAAGSADPHLLQQAKGLVGRKIPDTRSRIKNRSRPIVETKLRKPGSRFVIKLKMS
jgi:hypothetical protein